MSKFISLDNYMVYVLILIILLYIVYCYKKNRKIENYCPADNTVNSYVFGPWCNCVQCNKLEKCGTVKTNWDWKKARYNTKKACVPK
jgi:hypothetical protein